MDRIINIVHVVSRKTETDSSKAKVKKSKNQLKKYAARQVQFLRGYSWISIAVRYSDISAWRHLTALQSGGRAYQTRYSPTTGTCVSRHLNLLNLRVLLKHDISRPVMCCLSSGCSDNVISTFSSHTLLLYNNHAIRLNSICRQTQP